MKENHSKLFRKEIVILIAPIFFFLFTSCATRTIHVPIETVKTEYRDKVLRDSVYLLDSILIRHKGDTVFLEKYKYLYRDKIVRDSVFRTDSIAVPYPVVETKEVKIYPRWLVILACLGCILVSYLGFKLFSNLKS